MKKLFVLIVLIAGIVWGAEAQSKEITFEQTKEWKKVLKKAKKEKKLIFIDCYTSWCGPCKMVGPIIEELATEFEGQVIIGKCDVDENSDMAAEYGIRNIPTVLFFKNGEIVDKQVGAVGKPVFVEKVKNLL